jgi:RNA polymerase sigma factor (sigma-70 family)
MNQFTQYQMVQGCLHNDRKMQKELYEAYKDAMYTICYRVLGNKELALEALQDGFIQVFKSIQSFKGESTIGTWIKTIMARASYKLLQTEQIKFVEDINELSPIQWPNSISPIDLEKAINQLPSGAKMVFLLAEVEGYAHKEIAELLSISIGTSKSQLHFAKQKLQQYLSA